MVNLTERNILRAYFNFIDAISGNAVLSNQEFQTISIQLENLINNSALPQSSKSKIISVITTGKYSYGIIEQFTN